MPIGALQEIVFDCPNPEALARFWQALIGGDVEVESDDWVVLDGDEEFGCFIRFQHSGDKKSGRNRVQFDIEVDDLATATDEVEQLGARKIGGVVDDGEGGSIQLMADPAGNEFNLISG